MWGRRNLRSLMAAALYGELDDASRQALERRLAASPAARREFDALQAMVRAVPTADPPPLDHDLLPGIRNRLNATPQPQRLAVWRPQWAAAGALAMVLVAALFVALTALPWAGDSRPEMRVAGTMQTESDTPVSTSLREAAALRAQRDFSTAFHVLQTAVEAYPSDPYTGQAQQELARLYFESFRRYREAHTAYMHLRQAYPEVFMSTPENGRRLDILEEARRVNYASLESLDWAKSRRGEAIEAFEEVVRRYPATQVASLAIQEMAGRVVDMSHASGRRIDRLEALEQVRERCTDPIVLGSLDVELGRAYWVERSDIEMARGCGAKALECNEPAVVEMARGFLTQLPR